MRGWNKSSNSNWSTGVLIDGSVNSNSVISSLSSELLIDSNGAPHLVYMNDGALYYLEEKSNGWEPQFNTTIPTQTNNHGLDFVLDSADKPHLAWVDHGNGSTYYTTFNELTSTWESQIVRVFVGWNVNYIKSVSITVDDYDDPYIFSSVGSGTNVAYSQINYLGKYSQSIDVNDVPGDADGDGICDALDQATLGYEVTDLVFEVNTANDGYLATFTGLKPLSISISPQLPEGLNFDLSTGDITGIPLATDLIGSTYEISTTSINDPFSLNLTIKIWDESPLLSGYEKLPAMSDSTSYDDYDGYKGNQIKFGTDGSLYYSSSYFGFTSTGEIFDGVPVLPTHDGDDIFIAKRGIDLEWDWVRTIRLCSGWIKDLEIDDSDNTYILVQHTGMTSSNCDVRFTEDPSFDFETNNQYDIFVAKYDKNGNLLWVTNSNSPQTPASNRQFLVSSDSGLSVESNGLVTISFNAKTTSASTITFGGMDVNYGLTCIGSYLPYVARIDALGSVTWISSPTHLDSCNDAPGTDVISHSDGSATVIGKFRFGLAFGSNVLEFDDTYYHTFIAKLDANGNWQWAKNITYPNLPQMTSITFGEVFRETINEFSDGSFSIVFSSYNNNDGELNIAGNLTTFSNSERGWICAIRMNSIGDLIWKNCNDYGSTSTDGNSRSVIDENDELHILVDTEDGTNYFKMFGINIDGFQTYYSGTKSGNSGNYIYDMGVDNFGLPYFIAELNSHQWGGSSAATDYDSGQTFTHSARAKLYRMFGDIDHTVSYISPANNTESQLFAIGSTYNGINNGYEEFLTWSIYPELPEGLNFDENYGRIYGTPLNTSGGNITYTINASISSPVERTLSINITFGIAPEIPIVEFDVANHTNIGLLEYNLVKGEAMETLIPDIQTPQYLSYFTVEPTQLPSGINLNETTGVLSGTPTQNLTSQLFNVKACNSWNICNSGQIFMFTIVEPAPNITYPEYFYEVKKDAPILPIIVSNSGGPIASWSVSPELPIGITIDSNGRISGIPVVNTEIVNYTITGTNSGGSSTTYFEMAVNGTGLYIFYPYDELNLAINYPIQTDFRPSSQGVAVASWHIVPGLPEGLYFSESEGTIWGVPIELRPEMDYTITALGVDPSLIDTFDISLAVLTDYDGDGKPDGDELNSEYWMDVDDDNDNWTDAEEIACSPVPGQYNPLDSNDFPPDLDLDGICDKLDNFNDAPIILAYPNIDLELSLNLPMSAQSPILEGGGVLTWEISPELPEGLVFNQFSGISTNVARSIDFQGMISGTPTEVLPPTIFTVWANNSMTSASFEITISVLLDTNLDGEPDVYDVDDDGDGWSDEMEMLCNSNSLNSSKKPIDTDNDGVCDNIDDDDDGDNFIDTEEALCLSDPLDETSIPIFSSEDEPDICDALLQDTDGDGWSDGIEIVCESSHEDIISVPIDIDYDGICDKLDEDDDNDGWDDLIDAFPHDDSEWIDTDGDEIGNNQDDDDDNDNWTDSWEIVCSTDPVDNESTPFDVDGDGFCDVLDQDSDNDGVVNANDAFPNDPAGHTDTDNDGRPDTLNLNFTSTSIPPLQEDTDDDNDGWTDVDELACATDPLNATDMPDEDVVCGSVEKTQFSFVQTYWWCCALFFLLFALLLPLALLARERTDNVLLMLGFGKGPQPANTISNPTFISGRGTKGEPFVLESVTGVRMGDNVESRETITITNLELGTEVSITDLDADENENRFNMDFLEVQEDEDQEEGFGSVVFRLQFDDNKAGMRAERPDGEFIGRIRIGRGSVYILWSVTVEGDSKPSAKPVEEDVEEEIEEVSTQSEEEAKAEAEERIKKAEAEAREKVEREAREKAEAEERIKKAEAEAREKAKEEVKKEAKEEAKRKAETEERIKKAEQEAKEKVESDAESRLAEMEAKMAEKMAELEDKMEGLSKKEAELARVAAKAEFIDFNTIGVATEEQKDDLKKIKGVGPFLEEKLNAVGIFTFKQIASMTPEIEEQVNVAIEFFRGRIRRDKWVDQCKEFERND